MIDPLFWLGLSILLVAVSLAAVLVVALPALQELARAARSAEKLFDTLSRDLPPTLEAIRLTGMEISDLTDEIDQGVQNAGNVAKQLDQSLEGARQQAQTVNVTTQSVFVGLRTAWRTFSRPERRRQRYLSSGGSDRRKDFKKSSRTYLPSDSLPGSSKPPLAFQDYSPEAEGSVDPASGFNDPPKRE